jgi:hypothetical protein
MVILILVDITNKSQLLRSNQKNRVKDIFNNLEIIRGGGPGGSMS